MKGFVSLDKGTLSPKRFRIRGGKI